jgi:diguanylate cyclase (GGDEF)-like protein
MNSRKNMWLIVVILLVPLIYYYGWVLTKENMATTLLHGQNSSSVPPWFRVPMFGFTACALLCLILIVALLRRYASGQSADIRANAERYRILAALDDQRVTRFQNEALVKEIRERKSIEAKLIHVAFHDPITGLRNRAFLTDRIAKLLNSDRHVDKSRHAAIYIDLDSFKAVNDMLGHRIGDLLLIEVATRLKQCIREQDVLARIGGDEFAMLLSGIRDVDQAFRMAQRIITIIEEPISLAGSMFSVSASVGICEVGRNYKEAEDVLRDADTAMYCAKREGGARTIIFQPSMQDKALAALQDKLQLKAAIENNEFLLYYQPLVDMRDLSIKGMEGLIRWNHPSEGIKAPGTFIGLAEETGHIRAIGTWVLQQACSDLPLLQKHFDRSLLMSVNVSTWQLDEPSFFKNLAKLLETSNVKPSSLQLEITESIFLKDALRIGQLFKDIRALGVKIAFDDFGTGYSSLGYLERYPVDTLKIDQTFVRNMNNSPANADILKLLIDIARATGMKIFAEGVEEPEQASALIAYGCNLAQGYLYSRPVPRDAMIDLLQNGFSSEKLSRTSYKATITQSV